MKGDGKRRLLRGGGAALALCAFYLLGAGPFFPLHGMKDWPRILWVFGLVVIAVCALFDAGRLMAATVVGYPVGFLVGLVLQTDGTDPGGARTNNLWIWWTLVFLAIVAFGIIWEYTVRYGSKKQTNQEEEHDGVTKNS